MTEPTEDVKMPEDPFGEAGRAADDIHRMWPFIPREDAKAFYLSLGHIGPGEGSVRVSLWVLNHVLKHLELKAMFPSAKDDPFDSYPRIRVGSIDEMMLKEMQAKKEGMLEEMLTQSKELEAKTRLVFIFTTRGKFWKCLEKPTLAEARAFADGVRAVTASEEFKPYVMPDDEKRLRLLERAEEIEDLEKHFSRAFAKKLDR